MGDPTMSGDPAVEAAHRSFHPKYNYSQEDKVSGLAAAREALRPIRDVHQKWAEAYAYRADGLVLNAFLAALVPLLFTKGELERRANG